MLSVKILHAHARWDRFNLYIIMSLRLLLRDRTPRSLALVTETHALVIRASRSSLRFDKPNDELSDKLPISRCMVEFTPLESVDLTDYRVLRGSGVFGTLGLIGLGTDVFLSVISGATRVAMIGPDETVQRILSVEFCWCFL